jgi:uncharacterized membrane protein
VTLAPLAASPVMIRVHVTATAIALVVGAVQLSGRKGNSRHRMLGWIWVVAMLTVASTSLLISSGKQQFGPFSLIHLLSLLVLFTVPCAVYSARQRKINAHRRAILWLYWTGLILPGLFTLLPGRIMHVVVFGG